ncbi:hypothetical protein [Paenibacillus eucommiae]|uniref:Uncharacterized protein n=1 Tax=Paenibacillus eucommiae TaxID=1355755 RepID=A0ABS4ITS8_9BACL|nr:hypothetical protein [Paenibacillus eucommiae]MBP1990975.1 hypothetical protein [Paenibacillus eucommiae]
MLYPSYSENKDIKPLNLPHFPTLQQTVVWRNWELVPLDRLAKILGTTEENVLELAQNMGLRVPPSIDEQWLIRGYITIIRTNWHILPYDQLLELLGWSADMLAYALKEDDFLWVKLGYLKPNVEPVTYRPLTQDEEIRTQEIRGIIDTHFPDSRTESPVKPFDFLNNFKKNDKSAAPWLVSANPDEVLLNEQWTVTYPEGLERVKTFALRFATEHEEAWGIQLPVSSVSIDAADAADSTVATDASGQRKISLTITPDSSLLSESHRIQVTADQIDIQAVDEVGLLRGLNWLQKSMTERNAPYLKQALTVRNTRFDLRYIYSYFAVYGDPLLDANIDPYPDELLSQLSKLGVNGVWLQAVLYKLVPFEHDLELSLDWEKRIEGLRRLVDRAADYGIGIYLYYNEPRAMPLQFFEKFPDWKGHVDVEDASLCTSHPDVQAYIKSSTARLFTEVPKLAGLFTITMSENLTNCFSRAGGGQTNCPRCASRSPHEVAAEVNRLIAEAAHSVAPNARILCWTWGWTQWLGWNAETIDEAIDLLPAQVSVMSNSEEGLITDIGGVQGNIVDYSISQVGPSEKALRIWGKAKQRGISTVAKVQFNTTWECSSVPYLPTIDLLEQHLNNLQESGVSGLMLSWTLGGYPSLNLEFASQYYWDTEETSVNRPELVSGRVFGEKAGAVVRQAWSTFSSAFKQFPFDVSVVYNAPQNIGPANLLYDTPTGFNSTMVGIPYDDLKSWRAIYPEDVFEDQFKQVADGWKKGIDILKEAEPLINSSDSGKKAAFNDLLHVANAAYCHFKTTHMQINFVKLRDKLNETTDEQEIQQIKAQLFAIIDEEIELAIDLYHIVRNDSRIGFEASNHYFYTVQDLKEKVINCLYVRKRLEERN